MRSIKTPKHRSVWKSALQNVKLNLSPRLSQTLETEVSKLGYHRRKEGSHNRNNMNPYLGLDVPPPLILTSWFQNRRCYKEHELFLILPISLTGRKLFFFFHIINSKNHKSEFWHLILETKFDVFWIKFWWVLNVWLPCWLLLATLKSSQQQRTY